MAHIDYVHLGFHSLLNKTNYCKIYLENPNVFNFRPTLQGNVTAAANNNMQGDFYFPLQLYSKQILGSCEIFTHTGYNCYAIEEMQ